ncbi:tyrosine-type recombinase/integrase [Lysobacter soli]|nr:tyrosine-type recombinase/integrase [Lysobacter soli]
MSKTQYLQRLGQSWYLRVKVPRALQGRVGNTHIRRALGTRDLDEAVRRKWSALAQVRAYLEELSAVSSSRPAAPRPLNAIAINCNPAPPFDLQLIANADARPAASLDSLLERWLDSSGCLKTTRFQRQQAYRELRAFLDGDCSPQFVTEALAAEYVDERLKKSPDSPSTRRRKLSALGAFWEWMASRRFVAKGVNPWKGFRLASRDEGMRAKKRPYTIAELVRLFSGAPTYPALREVMALGLYTGARIDELCSLTQGDIRWDRNAAFVRISKSKTHAGARTLAVLHPIPVAVLRARWCKSNAATSLLFPELKGGGYDKKLSWHVGQAFRYYRDKQALGGETDFHSLRRSFITRLENLGVDQVHIARYVGHALPTLAFKVYSGGSTELTQKATGRAISYPRDVEAAVRRFLHGVIDQATRLAAPPRAITALKSLMLSYQKPALMPCTWNTSSRPIGASAAAKLVSRSSRVATTLAAPCNCTMRGPCALHQCSKASRSAASRVVMPALASIAGLMSWRPVSIGAKS